jgi:N6-L-threonylcarbamoyladenine synthase
VNHIEAHLFACQLGTTQPVFPAVGLVVSGGHTSLYRMQSPLDFERLGGTIDDAAGEAFDKVGSLLGLPYPGGPAIERAARGGDSRAYRFPRTFLREERLDFSFSGLKTAVRYQVWPQDALQPRTLTEREIADLAASFQAATVDVLVGKAFQALEQAGLRRLCVGGGVAANRALRERLQAEAQGRGVELFMAPLELTTDNAAMGALAVERYRAGLFENLDLDVYPTLDLGRR